MNDDLVNNDLKQLQKDMLAYLNKHWKFFLAEGFVFIVLGIIAVALPHVFTVGVTLFLGWLLLFGGIVQIVRAISFYRMPGFSGWIFLGGLQMIIGYYLVAYPSLGVMTLTILFILLFAMEGIGKIILSIGMRPLANWGWVFFSGLTSLLLAAVVWIGWPYTANWVLGLFMGINMLFIGWALVKLSLAHGEAGSGSS